MGMNAFDPNTQETETGGALLVQGQLGIQSEYQASQGYGERSCQNKTEKKTTKPTKYQ